MAITPNHEYIRGYRDGRDEGQLRGAQQGNRRDRSTDHGGGVMIAQASLFDDLASLRASRYWRLTLDGDPAALELYERHYSAYRYRDGRTRRLFMGPGEKLVLISHAKDALFGWRKFRSADGQQGVNCSVFRNEGTSRSSDMIREAMDWAWQRWPGARFYTYVNPTKIRSSNPGYCFKVAGWRMCGVTKTRKLLIFEALPAEVG